MKFELDRGRLLDLLVGHTLYNDPTVAVGELLQNAINAVRFQHHLNEKETTETESPMGRVNVKWDPDERELIVEDDGTGMDLDIIKFHLMRVQVDHSTTLQSSQLNMKISLQSPVRELEFLPCFMISDDIEIITCKQNDGFRIRMSSVHADYLLKNLKSGHQSLSGLEPHGTRIKPIR